MSSKELDYKKLGFKAGLEIHQQLAGKKLFCNCPAEITEGEPDFIVLRQLRASQGESGAFDTAALHEQKKQKWFEYRGEHTTSCLREIDEEPVSDPNSEAVKTAVMVANLLQMKLVDQVQIMRKAVVDGSNTAGFQRTMLVSVQGKIDDVGISQMCLEEDSCKLIQRTAEKDIYNLSRLGIPLLEITTDPDIISPKHLKETAAAIGMVLRSTGRVKRGLGTIRQDVNISTKRGKRVEIKGVQDLQGMTLIAENEVRRQEALADLAQDHEKIQVDLPVSCTKALEKATGWIQKALKKKDEVIGLTIKDFEGVPGKELYTDYRVGTELAGYAKAWGFGGIIHSDEDPKKYGLQSWDAVKQTLMTKKSDAFILVVGKNDRALALLEHVLIPRIKKLAQGVQSEVRKALADGRTQYLRPMPGAARMYPETDSRAFRVDEIQVDLPELLSEKIPRLQQAYSITQETAKQLIRSVRDAIFEKWAKKLPAPLVADILVVREKDLQRRHNITLDIDPIAERLLEKLEKNEISKEAIEKILLEFAKKETVSWEKYKPIDEKQVKEVIIQVVKKDPKAPMGALMGQAMKQLAGKADGKTVSRILQEVLKK